MSGFLRDWLEGIAGAAVVLVGGAGLMVAMFWPAFLMASVGIGPLPVGLPVLGLWNVIFFGAVYAVYRAIENRK